MKAYDIDKDGNITYEEFLSGLKEPMNERRTNMVGRAFASMDKNQSGELTVDDISKVYDVTHNLDFQEGRKTKE